MWYKWNDTVCSFWGVDSFIQHNAYESPLCCYKYNKFVPFCCWMIYYCGCTTVFPFTSLRKFWLFLPFGNYKYSLHKHSNRGVLGSCTFSFLMYKYLGVWLMGHVGEYILSLPENAKMFLQSACSPWHSLQQSVRVPVTPHLP